jgi:hypothetical protein
MSDLSNDTKKHTTKSRETIPLSKKAELYPPDLEPINYHFRSWNRKDTVQYNAAVQKNLIPRKVFGVGTLIGELDLQYDSQ